jgi:hypothetical protein
MAAISKFQTLDDLLRALGGVSPKRVRLKPVPGTATETDVVRALERENRLFELVEGSLVEKVMGPRSRSSPDSCSPCSSGTSTTSSISGWCWGRTVRSA